MHRYAAAVLVAALALAIRAVLAAPRGPDEPFVLAYTAVVLAAWYGGLGPGMVATLVSVAGVALLLEPRWRFAIGTGQIMGFVLFVCSGVFTSALLELLHGRQREVEQHVDTQRRTEALLRDTVAALAERERALEAAQRLALIGSWELDLDDPQHPERNTQRWSAETYRIFGYEPGAVTASDALFMRHVHPDDRARVRARLAEAVSAREEFQIEHRLRLPDQRERWVEQRGRIALDAEGRPARMLGTCQDITARKRAEAELRERDERLQQIVDAVPALMSYIGADFRYRLANRGYQRWFGRDPESIKGLHVREVLGDLTWQAARPHMERALAGETVSYELELPEGAMAGRWVHIDYTPDCHTPDCMQGGSVRGFITLVSDISERKQAEAERTRLYASEQQARAQAEASDRAKDQFLAVLSHELRTPLTPVLTAAQMLGDARAQHDPARVQALAILIRKNAELEARLIDDLLDLTRIDRGKLSLHIELVDPHTKIGEVLAACAPDIDAKRLHVQLQLRARAHHVHADALRLHQVIWNLISNAVKFSHDGGRITVATRNDDDDDAGMLVLEVRDEGVGIEPELLPRVFNAFEQGSRDVTRRFGGLGLGLAVSKALIDALGGSITAASSGRDRGATFTIELPVAERAGSPQHRTVEQPPRSAEAHRILLVEDDEDTRQLMAEFLESNGYRVQTADSVESALQAAQSQPFDLVVSDLGLPDGTGFELMRSIRERHHHLRGIALSGYGRDKDIAEARAAGFLEHVTKPPKPQQLLQVLAHALADAP